MLDAGVFPWMERQQQASGATTTDEIRGSVMGVWRALKVGLNIKGSWDRFLIDVGTILGALLGGPEATKYSK